MKDGSSDMGTSLLARRFSAFDYIKITILGFALTALWSSLHIIILPLRLLDFVPEALKNTYLDLLVLAGLLLAMLVQPLAGAISDHARFGWGRRRPYVLLGSLLTLFLLPGIGLAGNYAALFLFYCLLQISSNTVQGPFQGFIPDFVPQGKRGLASGVRGLFNLLGGFVLIRLIALLMDRYFAAESSSWLWLALGALAMVLLGAMLVTVLTVKEQPEAGGSRAPFLSTFRQGFKIDVKSRPDFVPFLLACFLVFAAWAILQGHALYYLMDVIGISKPGEAAGNILIVVGISMVVAAYPAGRLSDRVGRKPIVIFSTLLGALGLVALFFSRSYLHLMLSGGLLGISSGAWLSSQWAFATDLVGRGEEAKYLGLVNISSAGAGALSRLIGPVIDFFNFLSPKLGYQVMLLVCFLLLAVGLLLLVRIKERRLAEVA